MPKMVRKQIYIQKSQEERLKKVAEASGLSEAEVIRRALDIELRHAGYRPAFNADAWERIEAFVDELKQRGPVAPRKRNWSRDDLYEERMRRYDRNSD